MDNSLSRCSEALILIDAFLLRHQRDGAYDLWLERYIKSPGDHDDAFLFGKLVQAMFSGGLKGLVVDKWMSRMKRAFHNWDIYRITEISAEQIEELAASGQVIANLPKLRAVVKNAATAVAMAQQHGTFGRYLISFPSVTALSMDVANRFDFLGKVTTEDLLRNVGFDTAKPDRHITRWLTRMGALGVHSSPDQVLVAMRTVADAAKMTKARADAVVYLFCADRNDVLSGGICGNIPACGHCPLDHLCPRIGLHASNTVSSKQPEALPLPPKGRVSNPESFPPGSIGAKFYTGMSEDEIEQENPFATPNWLKQRGTLTPHRRDQIDLSFKGSRRLSQVYIRSLPYNDGCYPAFLAIAHGLARWDANSQEVVLL